jgi:acyl-CoA thioesterase-2
VSSQGSTNTTPWRLDELFDLFEPEALGGGAFRGATIPERLRPTGDERAVVDGSQLLGQSIVASRRMQPERIVKSAHMIFSRPVLAPEPIELSVETSHAGRSFASMLVTVQQAGRLCARAILLLDKDEPDCIRHAAPIPRSGDPASGVVYDALVAGREVRIVDGGDYADPALTGPAQLDVWVRYASSPEDPAIRQALLAQFCGRHTIGTAMRPHADYGEGNAHRTLSTGVLSLSVHFHEDHALDDWLLYSHDALHAGRGLCDGKGRVFHRDGPLLASFELEGVIKPLSEQALAAAARRGRQNLM